MQGVDPAVAEDLGIPMSPESADRHQEAGRQVGYVLTRAQELPASPAAEAMRTWIAGANRSQLHVGAEISRLVGAGEIRPDETDGLFTAVKEREESFKRWTR